MPRKGAAHAGAKKAAPSAAPATPDKPAAPSKASAGGSRWPWSTPLSLEDALRDDDSSAAAADRDPFTGQRMYQSPRSVSPARPLARTSVAVRRSLTFDEGQESIAKRKAGKGAGGGGGGHGGGHADGDSDGDGDGDGAGAGAGKKKGKKAAAASVISKELEAQRRYFAELDQSVALPEAEPQKHKYVLGRREDKEDEEELSPESKDLALSRNFPNAKEDYETYAETMRSAGVSVMSFAEFIESGADLTALLHADSIGKKRKKGGSPKKGAAASPASPASPASRAPPAPSPKHAAAKPSAPTASPRKRTAAADQLAKPPATKKKPAAKKASSKR